ncbi:MAG: hypothetical protein JSW50_02905 [Candidatus Latescibacterota bacterium]|nr:MAG: hypothetical protein JSW50_02905 [Candidatus Latescibacterota bacterium]
MLTRLFVAAALVSVLGSNLWGQQIDSGGPPNLAEIVAEFKNDPQGPFASVHWFCADGTINPADEPCDSVGGIRHAVHTDQVVRIARHYGIHIGQILAGTDFDAFLDSHRFFSRAKQYQIDKYLRDTDDGWVLRQARNFEGAINNEDEIDWGRRFLLSLCGDDDLLATQFFLVRELTRDIPHRPADTVYSGYRYAGADSLTVLLTRIPEESVVWSQLNRFINDDTNDPGAVSQLADMLWTIRAELTDINPDWRPAMLDLSLELELLLAERAASWRPATAGEWLKKNQTLALATAGCGYLEVWEWHRLKPYLDLDPVASSMAPGDFSSRIEAARRTRDWALAMIRVHYDPVVELYGGFEPLTHGFLPARLSSSVLFSLAQSLESLESAVATAAGGAFRNEYRDTTTVVRFRGVAPGTAVGPLAVVTDPDSVALFATDAIYASTTRPVTGTRALGFICAADSVALSPELLIAQATPAPVAAVTTDDLSNLAPFLGTPFFFAVSPAGQVVFKPTADLVGDEAAVAGMSAAADDERRFDTHDLDLKLTRLIPIDSLDTYGPDRFCGLKSLRLARLTSMFPNFVAAGFVVPFGVFREHLDDTMPGTDRSFWSFLEDTIDRAEQWRADGELERVIDHFVSMRLSQLSEAVRAMRVRGVFHDDLRRTFQDVFGAPLGTVPVLVRGDINLAGVGEPDAADLDVTVVNVISEAAVLDAIKAVWASVFSQPSYERRQRFLSDPESLYPSVLIQMVVDVEKSGVVLTTGGPGYDTDDVFVAFSWGVGDITMESRPERYVLMHNGTDMLLSPVRESRFAVFSAAGGLEERYSPRMTPVLNMIERLAIRYIAGVLRDMLPHIDGFEAGGPYEIEMGIDHGNVWLFQVSDRSLNKTAGRTAYLYELDQNLLSENPIELGGAFPPEPAPVPSADSLEVDTNPN